MLSIDVVSNIPTPYNAALFRELNGLVDLRVHFESQANALRPWVGLDDLLGGYEAIIHGGSRAGRWGFWTPHLARALRNDADVLILGGSYTSPTIASLLYKRSDSGPMRMFWGERFMTTKTVNSLVRKRLLSRTDSVLAVGARAARQYRNLTAVPVHVFPYASAVTEPAPSGTRERIGFVGQIIARKGLDLFFQACPRTDVPAIDIVGSGPLEGAYRREAIDRGLDVAWLGECANSVIDEIRANWAFQVVPSRYDGWGVVVNEALASGTPVVVSATTGAVELIRSRVNGWIFGGNDVHAMSVALGDACKHARDPKVRHAAVVTGRAFSAEAAARFLVHILTTTPGGTPPTGRSFIIEQWEAIDRQLHGWFDPDGRVPDSVRCNDPPPT